MPMASELMCIHIIYYHGEQRQNWKRGFVKGCQSLRARDRLFKDTVFQGY